MNDLISEIKEDIKQENIVHLWKRYGHYIVAACILIILSTAAYQWYELSHNRKIASFGDQYFKAQLALNKGEQEEAMSELNALQNADAPSFAALAKLKQSIALLRQGKHIEAEQLFVEIINQESAAREFRDLATILYVRQLLTDGQADKITLIEQRLKPVLHSDSPWYYTAKELEALVLIEKNDYKRALDSLEVIQSSTSAPYSLRQRAKELTASITIKSNE